MGSDRSFGFVFAAFFAIVALWPLIGGHAPRWWALGVAAVFLLLALIRPEWLRPLNLVWFWIGLLLHKVTTPVIMGLVFITTVVPIGLIRALFKKDPINLKPDKSVQSYWIHRDPPGPAPESFVDQF